MKIGRLDLSQPVEADAKTVVFQGPLERGKHQLQTWFYDPSGKELCGAFYVEALRRQVQP